MSEKLTREESQKIIKHCQNGQLYDIRNWIASGKSLRMPPEIKKTILSVAIKTGFHSLDETIASYETQEAKNQGLADAVSQKRLDLVELLVASGAELKAIPFSDVLLCWEPRIIHFFLDNGADVITGSPFALAFGAKVRTALRPFLECKRRCPGLASDLQEQADRALRKVAHDGDLKWVSLLMWAGANPRSRGPKVEDEDDGGSDEEAAADYSTALEAACYQANVAVLKRLKPDPERDNLTELPKVLPSWPATKSSNTCWTLERSRMINPTAPRRRWIIVCGSWVRKISTHSSIGVRFPDGECTAPWNHSENW